MITPYIVLCFTILYYMEMMNTYFYAQCLRIIVNGIGQFIQWGDNTHKNDQSEIHLASFGLRKWVHFKLTIDCFFRLSLFYFAGFT